MARLEFPLGQGWYRNLTIHFEDQESTRSIDLKDRYIYLKQVHGKAIHRASAADLGRDGPTSEGDGIVADGDFLKSSGAKLLVQTADCLPLVFIEREQKKVAIIHAGWRGLTQKIHLAPFESLGFKPRETLVWVGPSLNGDNFEVGPDVWGQFPNEHKETAIFRPHATNPEKKFFFVWNYLDQLYARLKVELVYQTQIDTLADESFASYRRARKAGLESGGRNFSWLGFA